MLAGDPGASAPTVVDYDPTEDRLIVTFDPGAGGAPEITVAPHDGDMGGTVVFADGVQVAILEGASGVTPDMVLVQPRR